MGPRPTPKPTKKHYLQKIRLVWVIACVRSIRLLFIARASQRSWASSFPVIWAGPFASTEGLIGPSPVNGARWPSASIPPCLPGKYGPPRWYSAWNCKQRTKMACCCCCCCCCCCGQFSESNGPCNHQHFVNTATSNLQQICKKHLKIMKNSFQETFEDRRIEIIWTEEQI